MEISNVANAARVYGTKLGHDFACINLLVTGCCGSFHAAQIAGKQGIYRILVP